MSDTCHCRENAPQEAEPLTATCRKCHSTPYIILDKVHIECKRCFLESCNKKLRSTIGKSKLLRNNDSILIAHSGGAASTALLDLIRNSIEYNTRREQKFRPSIIFVDTEPIISMNFDATRKLRLTKMSQFISNVARLYPDWPVYWTTIEMPESTVDSSEAVPLYYKYTLDDDLTEGRYNALLNNLESFERFHQNCNIPDLTDKQEWLRGRVLAIIRKVAEHLNSTFTDIKDRFEYVFTASSATRLANSLLVNVILGKGSSACSTVDICDRSSKVPILRPMRDFSQKEIAFYLKARQIELPVKVNESTFARRKDSIQTATEAFLTKLYEDYPSTYTTLLRTGNKMQSH